MRIVTYYDQPHFAVGAQLLRQTLACWGWEHQLVVYEKLPEGCPQHHESPFAFKPLLLDYERQNGAEFVLWVDTSVRFMQSLDWAISEMEVNGYLLIEDNDQLLRDWTSDRSLQYFGIERGELAQYSSLLAGFIGLNFRKAVAHEFLDQWMAAEKAGMFQGSWSNSDRSVSIDPRVNGHRHDQSCATLIARQMQLETLPYREARVVSWSDHVELCDTACVIVDRQQCCPQVMELLATKV